MTLLLVAAIVALGASLQSASGFGFSLIADHLDPRGANVAVVGMSTLGPLLALSLAATGRRHVRVSVVRIVTLAAIVGVPLGLWLLTHVGDRLLANLIALVVIGLTLLLIAGATASDHTGIDVAAGFASGVLATSTGTNGPPLVLALQARRVPSSEFPGHSVGRVPGSKRLRPARVRSRPPVHGGGRPGGGRWGARVVGRADGGCRLFGALDQRRFGGVVLELLMARGMFSLADAVLGIG